MLPWKPSYLCVIGQILVSSSQWSQIIKLIPIIRDAAEDGIDFFTGTLKESYLIGLSTRNGYIASLNTTFVFALWTLDLMNFHVSLFMVAASSSEPNS